MSRAVPCTLWLSVPRCCPPTQGGFLHPPHFQSGRSAHSDTACSDAQSSRVEDEYSYSYDLDDSFSDDLDPPNGEEVREQLASFLKESVAKPTTNVARKKMVEKLRSRTKMDMPMQLLVPKEDTTHEQWLSKMQNTAYESAGPLIAILKGLEEDRELDNSEIMATASPTFPRKGGGGNRLPTRPYGGRGV